MEKDDFTIKIHEGFGRFKFGSTPEDNEKIAPIYGGVSRVDETHSPEFWLKLIEETEDKDIKTVTK